MRFWGRVARSRYFNRLRDIGCPDAALLVAGVGRSGTSWTANLLNFDRSLREVFEPFHPKLSRYSPLSEANYLPADCIDREAEILMQEIIDGRVMGSWVDRDNGGLFYRRRLIKAIRINLVLGWVRRRFDIPTLLVVRHPFAVADSWLSLGLAPNAEWFGTLERQLTSIRNDSRLHDDFPLVLSALKNVDTSDRLQAMIYVWCVHNHVPLEQIRRGQMRSATCFYESLVLHPRLELERLFALLDRPFDWSKVEPLLAQASRTNYRRRDMQNNRQAVLIDWRSSFSEAQRRKGMDILRHFGLDTLYGEDSEPLKDVPE